MGRRAIGPLARAAAVTLRPQKGGGADAEPEEERGELTRRWGEKNLIGGKPGGGEGGGDEHVGAGKVHQLGGHEGGEPHERGKGGERGGILDFGFWIFNWGWECAGGKKEGGFLKAAKEEGGGGKGQEF